MTEYFFDTLDWYEDSVELIYDNRGVIKTGDLAIMESGLIIFNKLG